MGENVAEVETMKTKLTGLVVVMSVVGAASIVSAKRNSATGLAKGLARMRVEVDALAAELEAKKTEKKNKIESLVRQKSELKMMLSREKTRMSQLRRRLRDRQKKVEERAKAQEALIPIVRNAASFLKAMIDKGLPFKIKDRSEEIDRIVERMEKKLITPGEAVARLWERVEDELRLAQENGLYTQVIEVEGKTQLVDVAKLGMVMLYFQTRGGSMGLAYHSDDKWSFRSARSREEKKSISNLFEMLRKGIRTGFFVLPNGLPTVVEAKFESSKEMDSVEEAQKEVQKEAKRKEMVP